MPPPYTVLNARVKQKLATEAYWLSIEDELGVIFEGEQAFVYNDDGVPVNFKIGDGTKLFSELPYFIAYYSNTTNCKTLFYLAQSTNITTPGVFRNNSEIDKVIFINNSGSDVLVKIGTTDGGSEIAEISLPNGVNVLSLDYFFTGAQTVYFTGLTGVDFSLIVLYFQLDEAPAIPPTGSGSFKRWAYGTVYSFIPAFAGHTESSWDLITGYGKSGTDYEGAMLWGTNGLPELPGYLRTYEEGDTIGGTTGADSVEIARENLPEEGLEMFVDGINSTPGDKPNTTSSVAVANNQASAPQRGYEMHSAAGEPTIGRTGDLGDGIALPNIPLSNIVLRFTGIPTTT